MATHCIYGWLETTRTLSSAEQAAIVIFLPRDWSLFRPRNTTVAGDYRGQEKEQEVASQFAKQSWNKFFLF